jgi:hypothetical protein
VLPQFRQRKAGVVVNVTSSVTLKALPLIAAYRASKAAVNAFTESMALELEQFGVRAHLVLPGRAPDTRFAENARAHMHGLDRGLCRARQGRLRTAGGSVFPDHPGAGRRASRVARGNRSVIADAHSGRRRRRSMGGRGSLTGRRHRPVEEGAREAVRVAVLGRAARQGRLRGGAAHRSNFHDLDGGLRNRQVRVVRERHGGRLLALCLHD